MTDTILERETPLAQLRAILARSAEGVGASVIVTGDAGACKTTFFQAFEATVGSGVRMFRGACEDLSIPEPLGPVRELVRSAGWNVDFDQLMDGQRLEMFTQILELAYDSDQPTVLIIEDLHWADEASLDFVRFLARRIAGRPIVLLINSRDVDEIARQKLRAAFNGVPAENLTRIELNPLSQSTVSELADKAGIDGVKLYRQSGGNAFYVTELLRNRNFDMPASVQDAVLSRVDTLSDAGQNILNTVSIFPRRAELDLVMDLSDSDGFSAVEDCIAEGLLIDAGDFLTFRHEIARRAVENGLSAIRKRALHATVYNLLSAINTTSKARLMHHARVGRLSDAVRQLAPDAAREAEAAGAFTQSAEYYEIALEFGDELPKEEQADLLEKSARVLGLTAQQPKAIANLGQALDIRKFLGQKLARADDLRKLARLHWEVGMKPMASSLAEEAVRIAEGSDSYELAWAYAQRGQIAMAEFEFEIAANVSKKAIELAESNGFLDVKSFAQSSLGMCYWGDVERAIPILRNSLKLGLDNNFPENVGRGFANIGVYYNEHYLFADAIKIYDEGIHYCDQHEIHAGSEFLKAWRFDVLDKMGFWDDVFIGAQNFLADRPQHSSARFYASVCLARIAMRRGLPNADALFSELDEVVSNGEDARHQIVYAVLLAERAYLGLAKPEPALDLMDSVLDLPIFPAGVEQLFPWQKRLGETPVYSKNQIFNEPFRRCLAGDWQGEAAAWAEIGSPYHQALALLEGDATAKIHALKILDGLGAGVVAEFARQKMRDAGIAIRTHEPRASTKANPAGLTKRQLDVLRLLNDGLSNAEIGERLFVSAKTVDHHVSAILGKLEVSSRGEAAAHARKVGWV